jgi:predicted MFS family arabinose efflux permease
MLAGSAVLLGAFVFVELRQANPMLDLTLFRKPAFAGASIAAFVLSASMFSMFLYLTLYIQNVLGYTPLEAGLRFLPVTLLSFAVAPISGKLAERLGVRLFLTAGLTMVGAGLLIMRGLQPGDDWTAMLAGFMVAGAGIGMTNPALATAAIGVVEPARAGMASGINSTFRQVGIATGIAAWGAVFHHTINQHASDFARAVGGAPPAGAGSFADFISFGVYKRLGPAAETPARQAFLDGLNEILLYAGLIAIAGAVLSLLLVRARDFVAHHVPA